MARVLEQVIGIRLSRLVRDSESDKELIEESVLQELENIVQELAPDTIVEVIKNN